MSDCNIVFFWIYEGRRKRGRCKIIWRRIDEIEREESGWRFWIVNRDGDFGLR